MPTASVFSVGLFSHSEKMRVMQRSAGILPYRWRDGILQVLLAHHGGPYWRNRDGGAWSIIKGEFAGDEAPEAAARREFAEETGWQAAGQLRPLGEIRQAAKRVIAFAMEAELDPSTLACNTFTVQWPPHSGTMKTFPEIDRVEGFDLNRAREKLILAQHSLLDRLRSNTQAKQERPGTAVSERTRPT